MKYIKKTTIVEDFEIEISKEEILNLLKEKFSIPDDPFFSVFVMENEYGRMERKFTGRLDFLKISWKDISKKEEPIQEIEG